MEKLEIEPGLELLPFLPPPTGYTAVISLLKITHSIFTSIQYKTHLGDCRKPPWKIPLGNPPGSCSVSEAEVPPFLCSGDLGLYLKCVCGAECLGWR